jgi:hypothetical protein
MQMTGLRKEHSMKHLTTKVACTRDLNKASGPTALDTSVRAITPSPRTFSWAWAAPRYILCSFSTACWACGDDVVLVSSEDPPHP